MDLFTLNLKSELFAVYAENKSYIVTSYNKHSIGQLQHIINKKFVESRTWMNKISKIETGSDTNVLLDITDSNYCDLKDKCYDDLLQVTYFETRNKMDQLFIYQLANLLNAHLFVVEQIEYRPEIPLLSLQGCFVQYVPEEDIETDCTTYLDSLYKIS